MKKQIHLAVPVNINWVNWAWFPKCRKGRVGERMNRTKRHVTCKGCLA